MWRNDPRAKQPTVETTHLIRANRPNPKTGAKRPRVNRPGETTLGRNDMMISYQDRLKHLKLPSLAHRRRRGDTIQCFKINNGQDDIPCESFLLLLNQELEVIVMN